MILEKQLQASFERSDGALIFREDINVPISTFSNKELHHGSMAHILEMNGYYLHLVMWGSFIPIEGGSSLRHLVNYPYGEGLNQPNGNMYFFIPGVVIVQLSTHC